MNVHERLEFYTSKYDEFFKPKIAFTNGRFAVADNQSLAMIINQTNIYRNTNTTLKYLWKIKIFNFVPNAESLVSLTLSSGIIFLRKSRHFPSSKSAKPITSTLLEWTSHQKLRKIFIKSWQIKHIPSI